MTPLQESLSKLQLKDDELDQAIRPLLQEGKSVVGHALSARLAERECHRTAAGERVVKVGTIRKSKGIFSVKTRKLVRVRRPGMVYR